MKLVALMVVVVALLTVLGFHLFSGRATVRALGEVQPEAAHTPRERPVLERSETQRAQVHPSLPVEPNPSAETTLQEELAPDGKPWAKTMLVTAGENKHTYSIEWIGNTKRLFHDNGQLYAEVAYVNGKREGVDRTWYRNGQPNGIDNWRAGKREGPATYFNDKGTRVTQGAYKAGYRDGSWETWYEDGTRRSLGSYRSAPAQYTQLKEGRWTVWLPNGAIDESESGYFENDERVGP